MRKIQKLTLILLVLFTSSCEKEDTLLDDEAQNNIRASSTATTIGSSVYSNNELIIRFYPGVSEIDKATLRAQHDIYNEFQQDPNGQQSQNGQSQPPGTYKKCSCGDENIENWKFLDINVEPRKDQLELGGLGKRIVSNVDYSFYFKQEKGNLGMWAYPNMSVNPNSYIKNTNQGVTIAVLDTGIDMGLTVFNTPTENKILYNSEAAGGVSLCGEPSGWDFVQGDATPFDDDPLKHGSIISNEASKLLESTGSYGKHQILPVKVADKQGKIKYHDAVCGLSFAVKKAQIINTSFGWYDPGHGESNTTIYLDIINENPDLVYVASAGNQTVSEFHYPSKYDSVIAVASCNEDFTNASKFTNYGNDVDLYAKGEMSFGAATIEGTSFAAPQVSAIAARLINTNSYWSLNDILYYGESAPLSFRQVMIPDFYDQDGDGDTDEMIIIETSTLYNRYVRPVNEIAF